MNICISFPFNSFITAADALRFIHPLSAQLQMEWISSNRSFTEGYKVFDLLESTHAFSTNQDILFNVSSENAKYHDEKNIITFRKDIHKSLDIFWIKLEHENKSLVDYLILQSGLFNFSMAFKFDYDKAKWQSEESVSIYTYFKRPYEHLKRYFDPNVPPILGEQIDIRYNPGHFKETYSMILMAAPEIWFGSESLKYFEREKILTFKEAKAIEEVSDKLIYVKLFDWKTSDYEAADILNLQRSFRDWIKMDEVESELDRIVELNNK